MNRSALHLLVVMFLTSISLPTLGSSQMAPSSGGSPISIETLHGDGHQLAGNLYHAQTATAQPPTGEPSETPSQGEDRSALTAWKLYDPADPSRPELITAERDIYRLKENWEITRVEYVYKWWGLGQPRFDYQILEQDGNVYQIGDSPVDAALVSNLVTAISDLHPTSQLLAGRDHTDDYPLWHVELTGTDGERVVLVSFSTANAGAAPWNVVYNGRIYAQFNGALGEAISELFQSEPGEPAAAFFPGGRETDSVVFSTNGWPTQIAYGFVGLLPIADGFRYHIDRDVPEIRGYIEGQSSIGGFGRMVVGTITELAQVDVYLDPSSATSCTITPQDTNDPAGSAWEFTCPLNTVPLNSFYDYPIEITFETDQGERVRTEGRLRNKITDQESVLYIPVLEVEPAFMAHPAASDLLTDHVLAYLSYDEMINGTTGEVSLLSGEALLFGQTQIGSRTVRYTVGTPFALQGNSLTHWTLKRAALQRTIAQIMDLTLADRIYEQAPDVTLNLWYAENADIPRVIGLLNNNASPYYAELTACDAAPVQAVPGDEPFQAFSFGSDWLLWQPDFLLVQGEPIVYGLDLYPAYNDREGALQFLLPRQLDWDSDEPLARVAFLRIFGDPVLQLQIDDNAGTEAVSALDEITAELPGTLDMSYDTFKVVKGVSIRVASDGSLEVVECASP